MNCWQGAIEEKLKLLPSKPGTYLFRDAERQVIYVGKAVSLRNRVRSYFQAGAYHSPKIQAMIEKIVDLEYIVTDSEVEALILEYNLIKEHRPRYNVYLRDDKSYPYLKITLNEDYPRVFLTRRVIKDGSRYFGPYTRVGAVQETLRLLKKIFPFRTCKQRQFKVNNRPCLNYHIRRCPAPCNGLISREDYRKLINEICLFLEGRQGDLVDLLTRRMEQAAKQLEFELAAKLRDQLYAIHQVIEKQKVTSIKQEELDVMAIAQRENQACVMVFFVRGGRLVGQDHFLLKETSDLSPAEILTAFTKQYYHHVELIPEEILLEEVVLEEVSVISKWLTSKRGEQVCLRVPLRGKKHELVQMAAKNARLALEQFHGGWNEIEGHTEVLKELADVLRLERIPNRVECFDVSNTQGMETVASMVVFEEGKPVPDQYRRFKIREVTGPDDCASMQEVIRRRFNRAQETRGETREPSPYLSSKKDNEERQENRPLVSHSREARFNHKLPDLVVVDGGKGQLSAARAAMEKEGFSHLPVCSLAKKEELVYLVEQPEPLKLPRDSQSLQFLQRVRDEAHRFAITYHRRLREKKALKSMLEEVEGIGQKRRQALLKAFKTIEEISIASVEELAKAPGMNKKVALSLYSFFHNINL